MFYRWQVNKLYLERRGKPVVLVIGSFARSLINFRGLLLKEFVRKNYCVIASASEYDSEVEEALKELGVAYWPNQIDRTGMNCVNDSRALWHLYKGIKKIQPQIVLGYTIKPVIYGSLAAQWANVPHIFSIITGRGNGFSGQGLKGYLKKQLVSQLYRIGLLRNQLVFFQNSDDQRFFVEKGLAASLDQTRLLNGSGVDLDHFKRSAPHLDSPRFLLIARLIKEKGIYEYIEAARILRAKYPFAEFQLLGPMDDNPSGLTSSEVERLQREEGVDYLGKTNDVRPYIANSSVCVLPSYYGEGVPRSILEAMAMGRPIVTTNEPGCRDTVVPEENGFLVPSRNAKALAEAMEAFILDSERIVRMGENSATIAKDKYDVHKVNANIMKHMFGEAFPDQYPDLERQ